MAECRICGKTVDYAGQDCWSCEIDLLISYTESREDILKMRYLFNGQDLELTRKAFELEHPGLFVSRAK